MKQALLLSSALVCGLHLPVNGAVGILLEERGAFSQNRVMEEPFVLRQNLDQAIEFAGLRILEGDGVDDMNLGGSYVHLCNSVLHHRQELSLIVLGQDTAGRSIFFDKDVALRSKKIHLISNLDGARVALDGLIETTDGDLVIEAKGDVTLPAISVMGNLCIVTNGNVNIPQDMLVSGQVNIRAKNICAKGKLSFLDEGIWFADSIEMRSPVCTSELGITFMAGSSVDIYGGFGVQNLVVHTPQFTTHPESRLIVRNEMGVTSNEAYLYGRSQVPTFMINSSKLLMDGNTTIDHFDISDVPYLEILDNANIRLNTIVERPNEDRNREGEDASKYLFINRGRLRIRDNFQPRRRFEQLNEAIFEADLGVHDDFNNAGMLTVQDSIILPNRLIYFKNRGTIKANKMLAEHDRGIASFKNEGDLHLDEASAITANQLILSGHVIAQQDLKLYSLGDTFHQSGNMLVLGDLRLKSKSSFLDGKVKVQGDFKCEIQSRLTLKRGTGEVVVGKDLEISSEKGFSMVTQSAPIRIGGALIVNTKIYSMLNELSGFVQQNKKIDEKEFNLNVSSWIQSGTMSAQNSIRLNASSMANINGTVASLRDSRITTNHLTGIFSVAAQNSDLNTRYFDGRIAVDAETSKATVGRASADSTYSVRRGRDHTINIQSTTAAKTAYEGDGSMRINVAGSYVGENDIKAGQEFELTHTGANALKGSVKASKAIIHAKNYPIHDFSKIDAVHVHLDIPEADIDMRRDLHITSNRILELSVNNLRNHADIRGNFVAKTLKDFDNRGLVKGETVILNIGGTFFKRKDSTVHGTRKENIDADYWEEAKDHVSVEQIDDTFSFGGGFKRTITRVETDALGTETLSDRHNVTHIARSSNLDLRSKTYDVSGKLVVEGKNILAETQRYDTSLGSTTLNFGFMGTARSENDTRPVFQSTHLNAARGVSVKARGTLHADGLQAQSEGGDIELSAKEVRIRTLAESYVARRWSRSGFLGINSKSGVDYDVIVAQPSLSAPNGHVKIKTEHFRNTGLHLDANVIEVHSKKSFDLNDAKIEVPFDRKSTSWWRLGGTSVKGRQVIPLVFSARGLEKIELVSGFGKISGAAPMIRTKTLEITAPKGVGFREAVSEVKIEKEEQYGLQIRVLGLDISLASGRFNGREFITRPSGLSNNASVRYVDPNLHQPMLDQSGLHTDALDHSPLNFLSVGVGGRYLAASSHLQEGHGVRMDVGNLDLSGVRGVVDMAVDSLNTKTTTLGSSEVILSGITKGTKSLEFAASATAGVAVVGSSLDSKLAAQSISPLFLDLSLGGEVSQQTALVHKEGAINLGDLHVKNDHIHIISRGANVKINSVISGSLSTSTQSAIDTKKTLHGKGTAEIRFLITGEPYSTLALSALSLARAPIRGEVEIKGSQHVNAPSKVEIAKPSSNINQHMVPDFQTINDTQRISIETSILDVAANAIAFNKDTFVTEIIRILNQYARLSPEEKGRLHQNPNPIEHLLRDSFETRVELPKALYAKLQDAMGFAKSFDAKVPADIPDSYYMKTKGGLSAADTGDDISTLLNYKAFQLDAACLSGMAYQGQDSEGYESKLRTSMKLDLKFGSPEAGGVVAEYTPETGPNVCVTAFTGTQGLGEWAGYALDYSNEFLPASIVDSRLKQGYINANFVENYQKTKWQLLTKSTDPIVFTGHSRGGSVAQIAALYAGISFDNFDKIGTLTFGAPAVFSTELARFIDLKMGARNLKVVLKEDFIPHILGWDPQRVIGINENIQASYASTGIVLSYTYGRGIFNHSMNEYIDVLSRL